jgi:hypothetical protein
VPVTDSGDGDAFGGGGDLNRRLTDPNHFASRAYSEAKTMAKDKNKRQKEVRAKQIAADKRSAQQEREKERRRANTAAKSVRSAIGMRLLDAPFGKVIAEGDPDKMNLIKIGNVKLYRPRVDAELAQRTAAETAFRAKYASGSHTDPKAINSILQSQYAYFDQTLKQIIPQLASRHMSEFVLHMYDQTCEIDRLAKSQKLSDSERDQWRDLGPHYRRALKYLAECIVMLAPPEAPAAPPDNILDLLDEAFIAAEQLISYSALSDQTFGLFPNNTTLNIPDPGAFEYLVLEVIPKKGEEFVERVANDLVIRAKYVPLDFPLYDNAMRTNALDTGFKAVFGLGYNDCIGILKDAIEAFEPPPDGFKIPFVLRAQMVDRWSEATKLPKASIERLFAGFTITKANMDAEGRVAWKPKQEHRAYRRGFLEMPHPTGPHLTWSPGMAKECLLLLVRDLAFQRVPPEWNDAAIKAGIDILSNDVGIAFERKSHELTRERGFEVVGSYNNGIGMGASRVAIPAGVGEMDCLGYHPGLRLLILLEKKLVQSGTEPVRLRDDLSQFNDPKGFYAKYQKKLTWIRQNLVAVRAALSSLPGAPQVIDPTHIAGSIVTLYPSFASEYATDVPCVSIGEFFHAWDEKKAWPFPTGIFPA